MSKKFVIEVAPDGDDWKAQVHGNSKASKVFETQSDSIEYARERAKEEGGELIIKGRDGKIRDKNSYGNDPFPPKG